MFGVIRLWLGCKGNSTCARHCFLYDLCKVGLAEIADILGTHPCQVNKITSLNAQRYNLVMMKSGGT